MEWIRALYVGATVFGAGVTVADLIGVFSNLGSDDGLADGASDIDDADAGDSGDDEVDAAADAAADADARASLAGHDSGRRKSPVLVLLTGLRMLVYFSLGFGPVGWFATSRYGGAAATLAWSIPVGVLVAVGTRAVRSFMRRDLSSTVTKDDLIMEKGVVTVSIGAGAVGRVRISLGGVYVDRFAKSNEPDRSIAVGTTVRVVNSDDEYVYVESE